MDMCVCVDTERKYTKISKKTVSECEMRMFIDKLSNEFECLTSISNQSMHFSTHAINEILMYTVKCNVFKMCG